jgi:hypothetical protein
MQPWTIAMMADQHLVADQRRDSRRRPPAGRIDVDDAAVLDVGAGADADPVDVAAQHAIVPDARFGPDLDVADQPRARRDEGGGIDKRRLASVTQDRHRFSSPGRMS